MNVQSVMNVSLTLWRLGSSYQKRGVHDPNVYMPWTKDGLSCMRYKSQLAMYSFLHSGIHVNIHGSIAMSGYICLN